MAKKPTANRKTSAKKAADPDKKPATVGVATRSRGSGKTGKSLPPSAPPAKEKVPNSAEKPSSGTAKASPSLEEKVTGDSDKTTTSAKPKALRNPYKKAVVKAATTTTKVKAKTPGVSTLKPMPEMDLSWLKKLPLSPDKSKISKRGAQSEQTWTNILQFAKIGGADKSLVMKLLPDGDFSCYAEKILMDQIRRGDPWTQEMKFEDRYQHYSLNDRPVKNSSGYNIRLFVINVTHFPTDPDIMKLGKTVCTYINAEPGNFSITRLDKDNLYFVHGVTTWQNIISIADCLARLRARFGQFSEGWFEQYKNQVASYFAPKTINRPLARMLFAPEEMIHPDYRNETADTENEKEEEEEEEEDEGEDEDEDEDEAEDEEEEAEDEEDEEDMDLMEAAQEVFKDDMEED